MYFLGCYLDDLTVILDTVESVWQFSIGSI